jgi:hypothetical protein
MSIYASVVCCECCEELFIGKVLWQDSSSNQAFGYWHGSAGDGGQNWEVDELNHGVYAFLVEHLNHSLHLMTESVLDSWMGSLPGDTEVKHYAPEYLTRPNKDYLQRSTPVATLECLATGERLGLGYLLFSDEQPVMFSNYFDGLTEPHLYRSLWSFLARSLSHSVKVVVTAPIIIA